MPPRHRQRKHPSASSTCRKAPAKEAQQPGSSLEDDLGEDPVRGRGAPAAAEPRVGAGRRAQEWSAVAVLAEQPCLLPSFPHAPTKLPPRAPLPPGGARARGDAARRRQQRAHRVPHRRPRRRGRARGAEREGRVAGAAGQEGRVCAEEQLHGCIPTLAGAAQLGRAARGRRWHCQSA